MFLMNPFIFIHVLNYFVCLYFTFCSHINVVLVQLILLYKLHNLFLLPFQWQLLFLFYHMLLSHSMLLLTMRNISIKLSPIFRLLHRNNVISIWLHFRWGHYFIVLFLFWLQSWYCLLWKLYVWSWIFATEFIVFEVLFFILLVLIIILLILLINIRRALFFIHLLNTYLFVLKAMLLYSIISYWLYII